MEGEERIMNKNLGNENQKTTESGELRKLGFGMMRLPRRGVNIDLERTGRMVDLFMEAGFTYFDTAFIYPGSENAVRRALVERYPRESYQLATKLYAGVMPTAGAAKREFASSLRKTGAGFFDYYLLHSLRGSNVKKYEKFGLWDFVGEQKEKGLIRNIGFSFHDGPELLDEILTKHPETDFVQLQINYADWDDPRVSARANYETARRHGKPVVIMEPVKGGRLADPPKEVKQLLLEYAPGASCASWALRFAASLEGVLTVLSGMSTEEQVMENIRLLAEPEPLNREEQRIIRRVRAIMGASKEIPCTACGYCLEQCPKEIPIPDIFTAMNSWLGAGQAAEAQTQYEAATKGGSSAGDCIHCGACEEICPQQIEIRKELTAAAEEFTGSRNEKN